MKWPEINPFREFPRKERRTASERIRHVISPITGKSYCGRNANSEAVATGIEWSDSNVCRACRNAAEREARRLGKPMTV